MLNLVRFLQQIHHYIALTISHHQCILHLLLHIVELLFEVPLLGYPRTTGAQFFLGRVRMTNQFIEVLNFRRCKPVHGPEFLPNFVVLGDREPLPEIGGEFLPSEVREGVPGEAVEVVGVGKSVGEELIFQALPHYNYITPTDYLPYFQQQVILMGNQPPSTLSPNSPSPLYLTSSSCRNNSKSTTRIVLQLSEGEYRNWAQQLDSFLQTVSQKLRRPRHQMAELFWVPLNRAYRPKAVSSYSSIGVLTLNFPSGFETLSFRLARASERDEPVLTASLWNIAYRLARILDTLERTPGDFTVDSEQMLADEDIRSVKLCIPPLKQYFQQTSQTSCTETLLTPNKTTSLPSCELEARSKCLQLGLILAECILLDPFCRVKGAEGSNSLSSKISRVLRVHYYPLKMRILVAGLLQADPRCRFTCKEVLLLLSPHAKKIETFQEFHQRKADFVRVFGKKLQALDPIIDQLKDQCSEPIFGEKRQNVKPLKMKKMGEPASIIPKRADLERPCPLDFCKSAQQQASSVCDRPNNPASWGWQTGSPRRTLNISLSSLPKNSKREEASSLNYSQTHKSSQSNISDLLTRKPSLIAQQHSLAESSFGQSLLQAEDRRQGPSSPVQAPFTVLDLLLPDKADSESNSQGFSPYFQAGVVPHNNEPAKIDKEWSVSLDFGITRDQFDENTLSHSHSSGQSHENAWPYQQDPQGLILNSVSKSTISYSKNNIDDLGTPQSCKRAKEQISGRSHRNQSQLQTETSCKPPECPMWPARKSEGSSSYLREPREQFIQGLQRKIDAAIARSKSQFA